MVGSGLDGMEQGQSLQRSYLTAEGGGLFNQCRVVVLGGARWFGTVSSNSFELLDLLEHQVDGGVECENLIYQASVRMCCCLIRGLVTVAQVELFEHLSGARVQGWCLRCLLEGGSGVG